MTETTAFKFGNFHKFDNFGKGELTFALPGSSFTFVFSEGKCYCSENNNAGLVALTLHDLTGKITGQPVGEYGRKAAEFVETVTAFIARAMIITYYRGKKLWLATSLASGNKPIFTIPGIEARIFKQEELGAFLCCYPLKENVIPDNTEVIKFHNKAVTQLIQPIVCELLSDEQRLKDLTLNLVKHAQEMCDKIAKILIERENTVTNNTKVF